MKRAGVVANPKRPHAADIFERLARKSAELDIRLFTDEQTAPYLPEAEKIPADRFGESVDVLLALGGDGTVLFGTRQLAGAPVPVLGINLGGLGFLTCVGEDRMEKALEAFSEGTCGRDERVVADCTVLRKKTETASYRVLNDAVIGFGSSSHLTMLDLAVNKKPTAAFSCDGIIISTPTGSTGHALSAGGPIIHPHAEVFGISVICPHTLSNRPIVLPNSSTIEITVRQTRKKLILSADGQDVDQLAEGDTLRVVRSPKPVFFLNLPDYNYFSVVSRKLHWRGSSI